MNTKAMVILSGGQDSTTCAFWAMARWDEVHAITFNYGQRHAIELEAAKKVVEYAHLSSHEIVDVPGILKGSSPLVSTNALEQYADHQSLPGGLEKTFVPGRNALFLLLAANRAYEKGITDLVTGVCEEDYGGYPDCRQVFIDAMQSALRMGLAYDDNDAFCALEIHTPLMHLTKAETAEMALGYDFCYETLAFTHTAYDGAYPPTGHDHATLLRAKGFEEANLPDPLVLRAVWEHKMPMPTTPNYVNWERLINSVCQGYLAGTNDVSKLAIMGLLAIQLRHQLGIVSA